MLGRIGGAARRHLGALVVDGFFNAASRVGKLHPQAKPERHAVEHLRDIPYLGTGLREHLLDVYRPVHRDAAAPLPIVFYVHGGGFRILSKDTHWIMGLAFARRGYVVFNVSYRLAPKHRYPAAIDDVCRAFAWVAANAERYGGDPSRIVLAGESAGANLAASLALCLAYERFAIEHPFARAAWDTGVIPRAVVPACGVFQVTDLARLRRRKPSMSSFVADRLSEVGDAYLGPSPSDAPGALDLANPLLVIESGLAPTRPLPPFFLPVGTRDPLLPDTRRFAEALRARGVAAVDRYYEGEPHAFHALVMRENARRCWAHTFAFLGEHVPDHAPLDDAKGRANLAEG